MINAQDIKNGTCIRMDNRLYFCVEFLHVKPGKGNTFMRTKLKDVVDGRVIERRFNIGEKLEDVRVEHRPYQFLYAEEDGFNFMHEETYEQIKLNKDVVENSDLMKEGQHVEMMFVTEPEEKCLTCELPTYVTLEVTYTEPAVKGNTASTSALKECTLETGAKIMVPLFINQGDKITVNTTDRSYGQRV